MLQDELKLRFLAHRKQAFITCDERCFCWEIEQLLDELDPQRSPTTRAPAQPAIELLRELHEKGVILSFGDGLMWNQKIDAVLKTAGGG